MNWKLYIAVCVVSLASIAAAQNAPVVGNSLAANSLADRAALSSVKQTRVRGETAKATAELTRIIDEFDRNGLGDGQDAKMLRAVRDSLNSLTESQMQQVLALLEQAREAPSDNAAKSHSADAYAKQKQIYAVMQQTLLAFQQQEDLLELSVQFAQLAKRQNANFKLTKHLALNSMYQRELDEGRLAELHVQQTEQDSIENEVTARLDKLASLMNAVDPATAQQLSGVTEQVSPATLRTALSTASSELRQAHMAKAASLEHSAYKDLREFSRLARPPRDPDQVLTDAADQLKVTIKGYQLAMAHTVYARTNNTDLTRLNIDDEQGDLVDDVTDVSKDIEQLAATAFATLTDARQTMQEARGSSVWGTDAQKRALQKLVDARQQILDELKRRELFSQMEEGNKLQRAKAAQQELNQLADRQRQIMEETKHAYNPEQNAKAAAKQAALTQTLKAMQQELARQMPDAAANVEKAVASSQTATDQLTDNKQRDALQSQQKTIDELTGAKQQADSTIADLQQQTQELQQAQQMRDDIAKLAAKEQALAVQTAVAAAHDQNPDNATEAAKSQAGDEAAAKNPDNAQATAKTPDDAAAAAKTQADDQAAAKNPDNAQATAKNPDDAAGSAKTQAGDQAAAKNPDGAQVQAKNPDSAAGSAKTQADKQSAAKNPQAAQAEAKNPDNAAGSAKTPADALKTPPPTAKQLGDDQHALAKQTQDLQAAAAPDGADAAEPLRQANQQMQAAAQKLGNNAAQPAQAPEHAAIAALQKAQAAVDRKMDELKQQLGDEPDQNAAADAASQEVQQALQKIDDAQQSLEHQNNDDAGHDLQEAAGHVANAENQAGLPQNAQNQLAQAHEELAHGAASEAGGNDQGAAAHAAAARGLLQQAMEQGMGQDEEAGNKPSEQWKPSQSRSGGSLAKDVHGTHIDSTGDRQAVAGGSNYNGLPARDRAAITESGNESAPAQYQSMVQQYMKNLADESQAPGNK